MTKINVENDFNHIKLAQERHVNELISKIEDKGVIKNTTEIELNIEGCITDYPATPKLIDYFLNHLCAKNGQKKLIIKLDGLGNKEIYILYILVLEGVFFGINDKIENEAEVNTWKEVIDQKLKDENISLKVIYTTENKEYNYGN
jgi:hypothetical protein